MSLFNQASLVLEPAVYETSKVYATKPFDGSGDLSFSRSNDTATRVGPDGLIEKVRTNLILQSNSFDTTWSNISTTDTGGQSGYDGTSNAWLLELTGGAGRIVQSSSTSGLQTFSVYAKAGTLDFIRLFSSAGTNVDAYFDLSDGTYAGSTVGTVVATSIVSVGGGWYRCSFSHNSTITDVRIYPAVAFNDLTATSGNILIQDAMLESGDVMTDYIATTSAAVSVGPVANVPRLDYLNSSCPRLLLEPQRTNDLEYSEQADNAYWTKDGATISVNATASPSGYVDADKLQEDSSTGVHRYGRGTFASGTQRTFSVFAKKGERNFVSLFENNTGSPAVKGVIFNLNTGALSLNNDPAYYVNPTITDYGNGWYRCSATWTPTALSVPSIGVSADGLTNSYAGTTGSGIFVWGAQLEAGAYATSYIPTLGAAVTRGADSAIKSSVTDLIGQTEGTLYAEFEIDSNNTDELNRILCVSDGSLTSRVLILANTNETIRFVVSIGGSSVVNITTSISIFGGRHKVAFAYKASDYVAYFDGVQVGTNTAISSVPASLTNIYVGTTEGGAAAAGLEGTIGQALLFKTRLTNAQMQELTSL